MNLNHKPDRKSRSEIWISGMEIAKSVLDGCFTSDASANNPGSRNRPSFIFCNFFLSATILSAATILVSFDATWFVFSIFIRIEGLKMKVSELWKNICGLVVYDFINQINKQHARVTKIELVSILSRSADYQNTNTPVSGHFWPSGSEVHNFSNRIERIGKLVVSGPRIINRNLRICSRWLSF